MRKLIALVLLAVVSMLALNTYPALGDTECGEFNRPPGAYDPTYDTICHEEAYNLDLEVILPNSSVRKDCVNYEEARIPIAANEIYRICDYIKGIRVNAWEGGATERRTYPVCFTRSGVDNVCRDFGCDDYPVEHSYCHAYLCSAWVEGSFYSGISCNNEVFSIGGPNSAIKLFVRARAVSVPYCPETSPGYCDSGPYGGNKLDKVGIVFYAVPSEEYEFVTKTPSTVKGITNDVNMAGDPTDVTTGNMKTFPQIDFTVSGINGPFQFVRTYNSRNEYDGPLGYGWTHSYNISVTWETDTYGDDYYTVMDEEGKLHIFAVYSDGEIRSLNPDETELARLDEYPYTITWTRNGVDYHFPDAVVEGNPYYITSVEHKDGSTIEFEYEGLDHLATITDTHGRVIEFTYSGDRIVEIREPGRPGSMPIEYTYDVNGNLTKVTYPVDSNTDYERTYSYDDQNDAHNLTQIEDERDNSFYYYYDANDRCWKVEGDNDGNGAYFKTEFDYDIGTSNETEVTRVRGAQTFTDRYTYTDSGRIVQIDHQESGVTEKFFYDIRQGGYSTVEKWTVGPPDEEHPNGYFLKEISTLDPGYNVTEVLEGIVETEADMPSGTPLKFYYEDTNNPNSLTRTQDQRNCNLNLTYGSTGGTAGKVTKIHKYVEGIPGTEYEVTNLAYYPNGTLDTITDPNGKVTDYSYDLNGILESIDPPGDLPPVEYEHDGAGRVTKITQKDDEGNDRYTDINRDWLGRVTQITYPEEAGVRLTMTYLYEATDLYDANASYGVNVTDTGDVKTQYLYNSAGLLWKVVKDRGEGKTNAVMTFDYDAYGNLVALTDGEGHTTTFAYDSLDRLVSITDAEDNTKSFTYYPDGSLKSRTDQNGVLTDYTYNDDNRLWKIEYKPDGENVAETVEYTYEPNGLVASVTNSAGTVGYEYDDINRLESTNGALTGDVDLVEYEYHDGGQRETMTSDVGETTYDLNDWNALWKITNPNNRVTEYDYNQYTGNLSKLTRANNTSVDYDFDNLDRLESYTLNGPGGGEFVHSYEYEDSNLIWKITLPDGKYYEYVYDDLYRLTNEYGLQPGGEQIYARNYGYDLADNRTSFSNGTSETYTLNALNQVTGIYTLGEQDPHTTFDYDLNGNMTAKMISAGTATLDYDYENRLVKITYPDSGTTEIVYDALGRRLKMVEKNAGGATLGERHYVYDGLDLIAELDEDDDVEAAYTHGPGVDDPLIVRYNGNDYFYQTNHQGSVTELMNADGYLAKRYRYDAFGNIISETGPMFNRGFTYTSRERHARSGFYYYRARFYDPQTGRFITQDPIGHLGGVNLYAYVGNSPVSFYDPHGLCLERAMDWVMNDFVIPGPYGSPNPEDWGEWVWLPYEAGKFGKGWENVELAAIAIATAADVSAFSLIVAEAAGITNIGSRPLRAFVRVDKHQVPGLRKYGQLKHINIGKRHIIYDPKYWGAKLAETIKKIF